MADLIYNQNSIPKGVYRYGLRASADTGCGWIAVYNALSLLGYGVDKKALIRYFERQLPLVHGNAGTSFWGPAQYFHRWGFPVKVVADRGKFDEAAREGDVCVLFYRWRKGVKLGAHFVAVQYSDGQFTGYNTYANSTGPDSYGASLETHMKRMGWFGGILTVIKSPKTQKNRSDER